MTLQAQIKWVTNIADFKREIEQGTTGIVAHTAKVDQLTRSLSGNGLLGAANNYAAAVEKMGGVEKLTAAEKDRINGLVTKAIEKYEALGRTAPAQLQLLADQTRNAAKETEEMQQKLQEFGSGATSAGVALSAGLTVPIVAAAGYIAKLGMDAVESENLVSVSFGDMKGAADAWSAGLSKNLGLNRFETEKMAGTLFNMTTGMGIARDASFQMSTGVVKLAADMASFRNIPMEDALTKIKSGLTGEAEPLKAIGILVDDATIKTYAYANGIARQGSELTQQQKVMARWGAILKQTSNDQGDLARTLDSPANQLRIMKSRLEEAATELGVSFIPLVSQAIGALANLVPYLQSGVDWFIKLPDPVKYGALALAGLLAAAGPVLLIIGSIAGAIGTALPLVGGLAGASAAVGTALTVAVPVAMAFGVAIVAWKFGRAIADVLDLDNKIAGLAVRLGLIGDVKAEQASAKMNTLRLATEHAGRSVTDYSEAIRINQEWAEKQVAHNTHVTTSAEKQATAYDTLKVKAQSMVKEAVTPLTAQNRELALMFDKAGMSATKIATELNVSEEAVKRVVDAQKKATTAGEAHTKALEAIRTAAIPLTAAQMAQAVANDKLGVSAENSAKAMRISADAVSKYLDSLKSGKEIEETWRKFYEAIGDSSHKFIAKWIDDTTDAERKVADASVKALADRYLTGKEYEEKNYQLTLSGTALQIRQIELQRDATIRAHGDMGGEVSKYYKHQLDLANHTEDTIVERMRAAGVASRSDLQTTAENARLDYEQMAAHSEEFSEKAIRHQKRIADEAEAAANGTMTSWQRAYSALGDVGTILSNIPGKFSEIASVAAKTGQAIMTNLADGNVWGAVVAAATGAISIITKVWSSFFGTAGRDAVVEFAKSFGGFDQLQARLETLGAAGAQLWIKLTQGVGRNNPEQAKKVIEEINAAFAAQDAWMQRLPGLIEKYGLSWEQAGTQAKQAHLDEIARGLIQDFADLSKAGFDVTLITEKMGGAINDYVHLAMRTGTEIPPAMRPLLEKMIEMGTLTDLNGDKITDLEGSGISFATTLTQGFQSIVDAIHELMKALGALPEHVVIDVEERHRRTGTSEDPDPTGSERMHGGKNSVLPFPIVAHNGLLPDEVPAILQTGEAVLNRRAAAAVGSHAIGALNRGDRPSAGSVTIEKGAIVVNGAQQPERVAEEIMRKLRHRKRLQVA